MKNTKTELKLAIAKIIKEQFESNKTHEVEAEVASESDKKFVKFTVESPISFSEVAAQAIDEYYNQGGIGDEPDVLNMSVDGNDVSEFYDSQSDQLDEEDEMMKAALAKGKGKVDVGSVMNRIGGKLEMSPEERKERNLKGRGAQLGMAESTKQKIKKIIKEEIKKLSK